MPLGHLLSQAQRSEVRTLVEVVGAHGLADEGVVGVFGSGQRLQLAGQLLVQAGRPRVQLAEHRLRNTHEFTINQPVKIVIKIVLQFLTDNDSMGERGSQIRRATSIGVTETFRGGGCGRVLLSGDRILCTNKRKKEKKKKTLTPVITMS